MSENVLIQVITVFGGIAVSIVGAIPLVLAQTRDRTRAKGGTKRDHAQVPTNTRGVRTSLWIVLVGFGLISVAGAWLWYISPRVEYGSIPANPEGERIDGWPYSVDVTDVRDALGPRKVYKVTFDRPFGRPPAVVLTLVDEGQQGTRAFDNFVRLGVVSESGFEVWSSDISNDYKTLDDVQPVAFMFIATESPR